MPQPIDTDTFGFLINDVSRMMRAEMDRRVSEAGLGITAGEARTLTHAARAGSVRQNVLAERMGVEAMTLSAYVDRLEMQGLIARRPDPADRRAKLVELTPAAGPVLAKTLSIGAAVRADMARSIAPDDWKRLTELLKTARENLSEMRAAAARDDRGNAA